MLKASSAMAAATLLSRVLGLMREQAYMFFLGTSWVNDAFQYAFTIPNLFRRLLGEGALTAAFIPIFKAKEKTHGEAEMWNAANAVISGLVVSTCVIVAVVLAAVSLALAFGAPAHAPLPFAGSSSPADLVAATNVLSDGGGAVHFWTRGQFQPKIVLMLQLLRVMFPYMILVCLTAVMMGMLNARGHFFIPAMGATMLNVVMIVSVYWVAPKFGVGLPKGQKLPVQIFALAYGVLAAGVAQAAFQMPTLWRDGFRYRWVSPWRNETVRRVVVQMVPGTVGVAAFQINVALVQLVALFVGTGIVSSFNGAVRLMELPQGMFGISLATFLLPTLSGLAAEKNYPEFRSTLRDGLASLMFLNLLASVLLVVLAEPIVRLLFEHGEKFTATSTARVSFALICLAPGLVAFSTANILARAFYALGDTKTPMQISIICLTINFLGACLLMAPLQEGGPGIANTCTSAINVSLLLFALRKKLARLELGPLRQTLRTLVLAALAAGAAAWGGWHWWEKTLGHASLALEIGAVFVPAGIAGGIYWMIAMLCDVPAAKEMTAFALAKFRK
ncbi:MAG TPA: murein biosynthesis integral membrane protein MurJ [Candidatus Acidoferrales bacterium]|nr:murein biosynthesis integral membrane protein MurJ [Candidatus Acidoferrales bacterium]